MAMFMPESVSSDIILRLPVKSLLRFRCLSTSFRTEIDSADFAKNHLKKSSKTKSYRRVIIIDEEDNPYAIDFDVGLKEVVLPKNPVESLPVTDDIPYNNSCNGLALFCRFVFNSDPKFPELTLWNPFTRRYKNIPTVGISDFSLGCAAACLGYDADFDDYKIVMTVSDDDTANVDGQSMQVWVFSLKLNSWRRIQNLLLGMDRLCCYESNFANGALHWRCYSEIIGFDLAKERFFNLPLLAQDDEIVFAFEGNLYSLKSAAPPSETVEFYLCVNVEGGIESVAGARWEKAFAIDGEAFVKFAKFEVFDPWPLAYSKDGDSILVYHGKNMFWYNIGKKTAQKVEIPGKPNPRWFVCHVYWESLVSLDNESAFNEAAEIKDSMELSGLFCPCPFKSQLTPFECDLDILPG